MAVDDHALCIAGPPGRACPDVATARDRGTASSTPLARQSPLGSVSDLFARSMPAAPEPLPGSAGVGFPVGGMDAVIPEGLPINLAAAMQLSGVRPLDIAAAMAQVQQALALQLQAKVLWIPNLNGGITYFRHDGVQQDIFTGPNFRRGLQSFFVGGGPSLAVGLTDAIYAPLAARRVVASRRANLQTARNDVLLAVAQAYFDVQGAREGCSASERRSPGPSCL